MPNIFIENKYERAPLGSMPFCSALVGCILELQASVNFMGGVGSDGRGYDSLMQKPVGEYQAFMEIEALRHGDSDITLRWSTGSDSEKRKMAAALGWGFTTDIRRPFNQKQRNFINPYSEERSPKLVMDLFFDLTGTLAKLMAQLNSRHIYIRNQGYTRQLLGLIASTYKVGDFCKETIMPTRSSILLTRLDISAIEGEEITYGLTRRRFLGTPERFAQLVNGHREYAVRSTDREDPYLDLGPYLKNFYDNEFEQETPTTIRNLHKQRVLSPILFRLLKGAGANELMKQIDSEIPKSDN